MGKRIALILILLFLSLNVNAGLYFDGAGDKVAVSDNDILDTGTSDFAISYWVADDVNGECPHITKTGSWTSGFFIWQTPGNKLGMVLVYGNYAKTLDSATDYGINDGVLRHVVFNVDRSANSIDIYVNGVETTYGAHNNVEGGFSSSDNLDNSFDWEVGYHPSIGSDYFTGLIYDARQYNRKLLPAEIKTIYETRGSDNITKDLVVRLLMDEASDGTTASGAGVNIDTSPNNNNGTPAGDPVYRAVTVKNKQIRYHY